MFLIRLSLYIDKLAVVQTLEFKIFSLKTAPVGLFPLNFTLTVHVAVFPFDVFAVITAVPTAFAVISPL